MKKAPGKFLTAPQAAEYVGLSLRHFRRVYYEEGNGKFFMIGRKMFIVRTDLEAWQKACRQEQPTVA